jgi:RNA polymerase sigma-70 factor (ECF subfamily)
MGEAQEEGFVIDSVRADREEARMTAMDKEQERGAAPGRQRAGTSSPEPALADGASGTMTPLDDATRVANRAQFEREALEQLDALYSFGLKLTHARDEAEDLVSDTLLRAFDRWEQYRLGTNIRAWLFTILYHSFVSRKRRVDAREVQPPDEADGWAGYEAVGEADPEGRFYDSFLDEEITRAIDALPREYREAVVLSDIHELRYAEIAQILDIPEGTVKSRLFRGRRILQKKLVGYAVDMGYIKSSSRVTTG